MYVRECYLRLLKVSKKELFQIHVEMSKDSKIDIGKVYKYMDEVEASQLPNDLILLLKNILRGFIDMNQQIDKELLETRKKPLKQSF